MTAARRWLVAATFLLSSHAALRAQSSAPSPEPAASPTAPAEVAPPATPPPPQITWSEVHVKGEYIAMTFDDGPSAKLTPHLLDILKERNMHVTFFVVGQNAKEHPEILRRAVAEGHDIANHSWSHPDLKKMSDEAVRSELNRTKDAIVAAIGKAPEFMRPPYGSLSKAQSRWVHDDLGYKIILWDVDPLDWKRPGPAIVEQRILADTRPGSIILSHDIHPGTVEAMPDTFDKLLAKGFKFVTVKELLAMEVPPEPKPVRAVDPGAAKARKAHPNVTPKPTPRADIPEKITGSADEAH